MAAIPDKSFDKNKPIKTRSPSEAWDYIVELILK